ncbi:MAG: hypothetical protein WED08_02145 [Patescibacteria group bacterium]
MSETKVLVIATYPDEHASVVERKIQQIGGEAVVLDPSILIEDKFSVRIGDEFEFKSERTGTVSSKSIRSVWIRRPMVPKIPNESLTSSQEDFLRNQWSEGLRGIYSCLRDVLWVSDPEKMVAASHKIFQLQEAGKHLAIPRTIVTNSPHEAVSFFESCGETVVIKALGKKWFIGKDGAKKVVPTSILKPSKSGPKFPGIETTPVILQECIRKEADVRAFVIGDELFSASIKSPSDNIDWRHSDSSMLRYDTHLLPKRINKSLIKLVRSLGLNYAAADFVVDRFGNYYFLEINALGEFLWLEEAVGIDISGTLAKLLVGQ